VATLLVVKAQEWTPYKCGEGAGMSYSNGGFSGHSDLVKLSPWARRVINHPSHVWIPVELEHWWRLPIRAEASLNFTTEKSHLTALTLLLVSLYFSLLDKITLNDFSLFHTFRYRSRLSIDIKKHTENWPARF